MDFSRQCLDKNSEFGVLWYYGNKEGKIVPKDVEKLNMKILFQFIQVHKDVIEYEHWTLLFRGFFVIMLNRLELINRKFKALSGDLKKKSKPTISEFQLIVSDQVDVDIELLSIEAPPAKKQATKRAQKKRLDTLIRETPNVFLSDPDLDTGATNLPLLDDGFGGNLVSNGPVNVEEYFDLSRAPADQQAKTPPRTLQYADDLPDLTLSPIGRVDDTIQQLPDQDSTLVQDSNLQSREAFLSDRPSALPSSFRSADLSIAERISQDDQLSQPLSQAASQADGSQRPESQHGSQRTHESELSFSLFALDEPGEPQRRGRKRRRDNDLVIDERIEYSDRFHENNQKYHDKHVSFNLATPILSVDRLFRRPLIPSLIEPITESYYSTEQRDTDELVTREIPQDEDEQTDYLSDIGSPAHSPAAFSQRADDFGLDNLQVDPIEQVSRDLLTSLVDEVSMQIDREDEQPQADYTERSPDSRLDSRIEIQRDGSSRQISRRYYSDFEPMMVQSDYTASRVFGRRDLDLDSLASYRGDDELASHNLSVLSELSFSYVDTILDMLDENDGQITFSELTHDFKRREAAKCFADLLCLKMRREIEMIQHDTTYYAEIYIKKI